MSGETRVILGFIAALAISLPLTELARLLAMRTGFYDHPVGYKLHRVPTPYLGGLAVVSAALLASVVFADALGRYLPLSLAVVALLALGTLDDRVGLGVVFRFAVQIAAGVALWFAGLGWQVMPGEVPDLVLTIVWVVGIVNAFNLMDNQDGAAGTVAAACLVGGATAALIRGDPTLAALDACLAGACAGFLPFNLAVPSRIFLGDGGSMPIGLAVAVAVMALPGGDQSWTTFLATVPLVGLPILDTTLVVVSRRRRGAMVLSGARDHLTHRLLAVLGTPKRVALMLALAQTSLCSLAIILVQLDPSQVVVATVLYVGAGLGAVAWLDTRLAPAPSPALSEP